MTYWLGFLAGLLSSVYFVDVRRRALNYGPTQHASPEMISGPSRYAAHLAELIPFPAEEQSLYEELEELDDEGHDWYKPNLIAGAKQLLVEGNEFSRVAKVYGDRITAEAERQLKVA